METVATLRNKPIGILHEALLEYLLDKYGMNLGSLTIRLQKIRFIDFSKNITRIRDLCYLDAMIVISILYQSHKYKPHKLNLYFDK